MFLLSLRLSFALIRFLYSLVSRLSYHLMLTILISSRFSPDKADLPGLHSRKKIGPMALKWVPHRTQQLQRYKFLPFFFNKPKKSQVNNQQKQEQKRTARKLNDDNHQPNKTNNKTGEHMRGGRPCRHQGRRTAALILRTILPTQ